MWDSLFHALQSEDYERVGLQRPRTRAEMLQLLKDNSNADLRHVRWNGEWLAPKFVQECRDAIAQVEIRQDGYPCSVCDPLLIHVCAVLRVDIKHVYCGNAMMYSVPGACRRLGFSSDQGHFHRNGDESYPAVQAGVQAQGARTGHAHSARTPCTPSAWLHHRCRAT